MMDWSRLLSARRLGESLAAPSRGEEARGPFHKDADRIIYSSAFRRLQDKTQVQPFPGSDYLRTRLTHSLEAAAVGRSLGGAIGRQVLRRHGPLTADRRVVSEEDFASIVAAACLAHDIGNPPFGHAGEDAIRHWFANDGAVLLTADMSPAERRDLERFEGNAQGFRILTRLQTWRESGGLRLTAAALGAFSKYPQDSLADPSGKLGYFQAERTSFAELASVLGLIPAGPGAWCRHPLAILVEAADDICYTVVDLEDGVKAGKIAFDEAAEPLNAIAGGDRPAYDELDDAMDRIGYLRAKAIGALIEEARAVFLDNEREILAGAYQGSLIDRTKSRAAIDTIRVLARDRLFHDPAKLEAELGGLEVVCGLLTAFGGALDRLADSGFALDALSPRDRRIMRVLPGQAQARQSRYELLLRLTDYVSGMTDRFALGLHRRLTGQNIGQARL
ncbi:MAG: dNTP triphosphohydrolase [Alphaproteobacteria bacterium]|nr:dNTP triphosphohydrolase [Alphaproteobacteria bacterium]